MNQEQATMAATKIERETQLALEFKLEQQSNNHKLAMTVAIISWSMLFATLLLGYFVYRFSQTVWPPLGVATIPMLLPNISLLVVVASSVSLFFATKFMLQKKYIPMRRLNIVTLILGFVYMISQFRFWETLNDLNLFSSTNIFGSILHGFTWIHAGHMVCALVAMIWGIWVLRNDAKVTKWQNYMLNVGMFWHFLTVVWLVLYCTLFIF